MKKPNPTPATALRTNLSYLLGEVPHVDAIRNASLSDDIWHIDFGNTKHPKRGTIDINFNQVIAPGGESLLDEGNEHDLLTAKMYVALSLSPVMDRMSSNALTEHFRSLLMVVRWRNEQGLRRMEELTDSHFHDYATAAKYGSANLLPLYKRAIDLLEEMQNSRRHLLTYTSYHRTYLDWRHIAQQLGLSEPQGLPAQVRQATLEYLASYDPKFYEVEVQRLDMREIEDVAPPVTSSRVSVLLEPWETLWRLREYMHHDPLSVDAFRYKSRSKIASGIGQEVERTPDIPPHQAAYLINQALLWVFEYAPILLKYLDAVGPLSVSIEQNTARANAIARSINELNDQVGSHLPFKILPVYQVSKTSARYSRSDGLDIRKALFNHLVIACYIVIATLSGRRSGEIEGLDFDCIQRNQSAFLSSASVTEPEAEFLDPAGGDLWLTTWIEKTLRQLDRTPVPKSVEIAVNVLKRIHEQTITLKQDNWLFRIIEPIPSRRFVDFKANEFLQDFADFIQVPPLKDGTTWGWSTHQVRRFYIVTYYYRFDFPWLLALSFHLRHFNIEMTKRYITRAIVGGFGRMMEQKRRSRAAMRMAKKADLLHQERIREFDQERLRILAR